MGNPCSLPDYYTEVIYTAIITQEGLGQKALNSMVVDPMLIWIRDFGCKILSAIRLWMQNYDARLYMQPFGCNQVTFLM